MHDLLARRDGIDPCLGEILHSDPDSGLDSGPHH